MSVCPSGMEVKSIWIYQRATTIINTLWKGKRNIPQWKQSFIEHIFMPCSLSLIFIKSANIIIFSLKQGNKSPERLNSLSRHECNWGLNSKTSDFSKLYAIKKKKSVFTAPYCLMDSVFWEIFPFLIFKEIIVSANHYVFHFC